jgi:hypothetical protein
MANTEEGKAISSKNAITHGILSQKALLPWEDAGSLEKLSLALENELKPIGELEGFLVDRIVADIWRLRRALVAESAHAQVAANDAKINLFPDVFSKSKEMLALDADAAPVTHPNSDKIARYATSIERSMYRALHELQRIQAVRMGQTVIPPAVVEMHGMDQG